MWVSGDHSLEFYFINNKKALMNSWNLLIKKGFGAEIIIRFKKGLDKFVDNRSTHRQVEKQAEVDPPAFLCDGCGCWGNTRVMTAESGLPGEHLHLPWSQAGYTTLTAGLIQ